MHNKIKLSQLDKYSYFGPDFIASVKDTGFMTMKEAEYKLNELYFKANLPELLAFYRVEYPKVMSNPINQYRTPTFYELAPIGYNRQNEKYSEVNNFTIYHTPFAYTLSKKLSELIFAKAPSVRAQGMSEEDQKFLEESNKFNSLPELLMSAGMTESWSGQVAFKVIVDQEFSEYPIIQEYSFNDIIINTKYNKLVSVIFKDVYEHDGVKYVLFSEYGYGYINYRLIDGDNNTKPLGTIPELAGLKDLKFNTPIMLAVLKKNNGLGKSDYYGLFDDFQAIDEIYSKKMNFIRKVNVKIPKSEKHLVKDEEGNRLIKSTYDTDYELYGEDGTAADLPRVQIPEIDRTINGYNKALDKAYGLIASQIGLSRATLLDQDNSGANTSAAAIKVRRINDFKARQNKVLGWDEALTKLFNIQLALKNVKLRGNYLEMDYKDYEYNITFYDSANPQFSDITEEETELLKSDLTDLKSSFYRVWRFKLLTEEEIDIMWAEKQRELQEKKELEFSKTKQEEVDTPVLEKDRYSDGHTPESIATLHNVPVQDILDQIEKGIKVEREHTTDKDEARLIAMDHLVELPDYYTRLDKMEENNEELQEIDKEGE